jgi:hypothetical protein
LIPYIAYPFSADTLVDVMLGPGSDAKAIQAAEAFLKSQKISVPPRVSKIPFRPW